MKQDKILLEKDNFFQYFNSMYGRYQDEYIKILPNLNKFQRTIHGKEFYDITIRCNNALVTSINYFKKNNIKYYGNYPKDKERVLMLACESYIYNLFSNAQDELCAYMKKNNEISDKVVKDYKFKILKKFGQNTYYKIFKKQYDISSNYKDIQYHVTNFINYGEQIINFNPDTDLDKALEAYLPVLMHNVKKYLANTKMDEMQIYNEQFKHFHYHVVNIYQLLFKLKKYETAKKLCDLETKIINEEFNIIKEKVKAKELKKN